jgi:hypothetical protein
MWARVTAAMTWLWTRATTGLTWLLRRFDANASKRWFRTTAAVGFTLLHLVVFAQAGHSRLGIPFNSVPDQKPYFTNTKIPATRTFPRQPINWSRLVVSRWDSQIYIGMAVRGVSACPTDPDRAPNVAYLDCGLGWLPAYGALGGVISSATGIAEDIALLLVSLVCAVTVNMLWTHRAFVDRLGKREAYLALLGFNLFPTAFYMVAPYTESMTFALALGTYVAISEERWVLGGAMVGAATALRIPSLAYAGAYGLAAIVATWRRRRAGKPRWWWPMLGTPLVMWGLIVETVVLWIMLGDPTVFWRARAAFGDKHDPGRLIDPTWFMRGLGAQHMDVALYFAVCAILALTFREIVRRFRTEQAVYLVAATIATMIGVVLAPIEYWGMNRYLLMCPLTAVGVAIMARKHTALFVLWAAFCIAFYWHVEMCSYVAQGNPEVCPCLGRFEFALPI